MSWRNDVTTETLTAAQILPGMTLLIRDAFKRPRIAPVIKIDPLPGGQTMLWCGNGFHLKCDDNTAIVTVI